MGVRNMKKAVMVILLAFVVLGMTQQIAVAETNAAITPESLSDAYTAELIGGYIYRWDNFFSVYADPISVSDPGILQPYGTFWIELPENEAGADGESVNIIFEQPTQPDVCPNYPGIPYPLKIIPTKFYTISFPVVDGTNNAYKWMKAWGPGSFTDTNYDNKKWGISKYIYNVDSDLSPGVEGYNKAKFYYKGDDTFETLFGTAAKFSAGQGYFFYQYDLPFFMLSTPSGLVKPTDPQVELKLPYSDPDDLHYTLHHVGNPYWGALDLSTDVLIGSYDSSKPLGKVASSIPLSEAEFWHIDLSLSLKDETGIDVYNIDKYNKAGVSTNYVGADRPLKALDLVGPADYFRLSLSDPLSNDATRFSYDFRSKGLHEYAWEIELSTAYDEVGAVLNLKNFDNVPENFSLSLKDVETGQTYSLSTDTSIDVQLTSDASRIFMLTASESPTEVEETENLAEFAINKVFPNPFNPSTTIEYTVDEAEEVNINVYSVHGQLIERLANGAVEAGHHSIVWDASGHAAGVYIVVMQSGAMKDMKKITLVK